MQPHSILLWAEPKNEEFDSIAQKGFKILTVLKKFGADLSPNFILESKSKKYNKFDFNMNSFRSILYEHVNKEGTTVFPDLGYHMLFSNSLNKNSVGIHLVIGISFVGARNFLNINLTEDFNIFKPNTSLKIINVVKELINVFQPFWSCVSNRINKQRFHKYVKNNKPTAVHWLNFWGSKLLNELNISNWENAPIEEYEKINDGYFIKLKKEPIDDENENDLLLQQNANRFFNLI